MELLESYEIIEDYPHDKYVPSALVHAVYRGEVFHVLFALDLPGKNVRVVTAYRPDLGEWESGLKKRRRSP
jgi:hypothetical protein